MNIERLATIDSTNSELMRRAASGDYRTVCLVAKEQTAGRGRLGRSWLSNEHSLTFSLGLPLAPLDWSGLSLAVGVSIAESLHERIQIKWPNDLWVDGKKLAGILIETTAIKGEASRYAVMGVGVNLQPPAMPSKDASLAFKTPPTGLDELIPGITPEQALKRVLEPLLSMLTHFEQQGWPPYAKRFAARDALEGKTIRLSSGMAGQYKGVSALGALLLQTESGCHPIISHEVSVCA